MIGDAGPDPAGASGALEPLVPVIQGGVDQDEQQVQDVERQDVADVVGHDFVGYAEEVSHHDDVGEAHALPARAPAGPLLVYGQRPRRCEA